MIGAAENGNYRKRPFYVLEVCSKMAHQAFFSYISPFLVFSVSFSSSFKFSLKIPDTEEWASVTIY